MITNILNMMARLNRNASTPSYSRETLKSGSKQVFYDTVGALLGGIDQEGEPPEIDQELIVNALETLEYDGNYGKNVFTPIGAPHTWPHCLAILEFLAQVAQLTYNIDQEAEEDHFADDINTMIIKTC